MNRQAFCKAYKEYGKHFAEVISKIAILFCEYEENCKSKEIVPV